jgi:hypothetical protein
MPGEHKKWGDFEKGMSEISSLDMILQEEVGINHADALPDPDDMASHPTQEEVGINIAKELPDPDDMASHPTKESHNPLDIPFGYEVGGMSEINMNPKDPVEEGGPNSGRNPEGGQDSQPGTGQGPLISFGETIMKQYVDSKINCPCHKN